MLVGEKMDEIELNIGMYVSSRIFLFHKEELNKVHFIVTIDLIREVFVEKSLA